MVESPPVARGRIARWSTAAGWLVFVPIIGLHALFVATYPLNNRGGDAGNYFEMLVHGRSSLVHAGGYPFLIGLAARVPPLTSLAETPARFDEALQVTQHAIALGAMIAFFTFLRRVYGSLTAALATLFLGVNLQLLGATSSTYPEWLQAALLVLAGAAAGRAFQRQGARKLAWYGVSIVLFTWCILVKFNAAVLGVFYLAPAIAERQTFARKIVWGLAMAYLAAVNIAIYQFVFHQPSTGTRRLTADTGWVLLTKVQSIYGNRLDPASGRATKRWLALATALPMEYGVAGAAMFSHVNAVPENVRAPYRHIVSRITAADDRFLDDWLRTHPLPEGFSVGVSVIPVCYYVGLLEGNDLGVAVAREAVASRPGFYAANVWRDVRAAAATQQWTPLFPMPDNMRQFGFTAGQDQANRTVRLTQPPQLWNVPYGYRTPAVWWPGVRLFDWLEEWRVPARLVSTLMGLALAAAVAGCLVRRRFDHQDAVTLTLGACLATLVLASCMTLEFRWKELCLAMPLIAALGAVGATVPMRVAARAVRRIRRA